MNEIKRKDNTGVRKFLPVLGMLMLVALGAIAWVFAPDAIALTKRTFPAFSTAGVNPMLLRAGFAFIVWVVLAGVFAIVLTIFTPKKGINVREGDLAKERKQMLEARELAKRRQRKMNNAARKDMDRL